MNDKSGEQCFPSHGFSSFARIFRRKRQNNSTIVRFFLLNLQWEVEQNIVFVRIFWHVRIFETQRWRHCREARFAPSLSSQFRMSILNSALRELRADERDILVPGSYKKCKGTLTNYDSWWRWSRSGSRNRVNSTFISSLDIIIFPSSSAHVLKWLNILYTKFWFFKWLKILRTNIPSLSSNV